MTYRLTKILATFGGLVIVVILAIILLLSTESGSRWLVQYGSARFPGRLVIKRIQGTVISGLSLDEIDYNLYNQYVSIEHIDIKWRPGALLAGRVHIQSLYMKGIKYNAPFHDETPAKSGKELPANIFLPIELKIDDANLERFIFRRGDTELVLDLVRLAGEADRHRLLLQNFETKTEDLHIDLKGHTKLKKPYPFEAKLKWRARLQEDFKARAVCSIKGNINTIKFSHQLSEPYLIKAAGEVNIHILDESESDGLQQYVGPSQEAKDADWKRYGQHVIQPGTKSYQLTYTGAISGKDFPTMQIQAEGIGNGTSFEFEKFKVHALDGKIKVNGHIAWIPEPTWLFAVSGDDINPGVQWPEWSGTLALNAKVQGDIDSGYPIILLNELSIDGHLLEQPFQVAGDLTFKDRRLEFQDIRIYSGENRLNLNGSADKNLKLMFNADASDPGSLWTGLMGHLKGKGSIEGPLNNLSGTITLKGQDIRYGNYSVRSLNAYFVFDAEDTSRSNARIKLFDLLAGDETFPCLTLKWDGNFKNHNVHAELVSTSATAEIGFRGSFYQDNLKLHIDTASFDLEKCGILHLINPVDLLVSHTEMKPFKACWLKENSSMCVQASWNKSSGWQAEGDLDAAPLKKLIDLLYELLKKENLSWEKGT